MKSPARAYEVVVYPIALDLRGRTVLVAGGGTVAERKVRGLLEAGARVVVVAPRTVPALAAAAERGEFELRARAFEPADLDGALLAFAATDDPVVNAALVVAARQRGVLVDDATDACAGDFVTPLAYRTGSLTFAVDSGGASPSFTLRLVAELRERFDERYGRAAATLARARDYVKAVVPAAFRAAVMTELASRDIALLAAMNPSVVENEVEAAYAAMAGTAENVAGASQKSAENAASGPLVCATRASALAMWQTRHVMAALARAGIASTVLQVSTRGDRVQDRPLTELGTDGVFIKELERALREGRADYAVHSAKDLPSELASDMQIAAIGPRADARDAFCSERYASLEALPAGAVVGTSSPRRRAQLQALRPDLRFETIRGNVDTRLRKLRDGAYDAIVLACAGLERLGLRAAYTSPIPLDVVTPAVAQGALAVETRAEDAELAVRIHRIFADPPSELAVRAERAFLRTLRGGCQAPVGAHAALEGASLTFRAVLATVDGSRVVRGGFTIDIDLGDPNAASVAEARAVELARRLQGEGGEEILAAVRAGTPLAEYLFLLPRTQSRPSQIARALRAAGAEVVEATDSDGAALAFGERLPGGLLFPSSGSVRAVGDYLAQLRREGVRPFVAVMGEASAAAAREAGFPPDVIATEANVGAFVHGVMRHLMGRVESER